MKKRTYVLFGTGDYYERYKAWFKDREVVALLDNSAIKQGTVIDGIPVVSPERIKDLDYDVVVIMSFYAKEMRCQLLELGVDPAQIYHFYDLHELFSEENENCLHMVDAKRVLLLTHDLSLGGPALALFNAARVLKKNNFDVYMASMQNGPLFDTIAEENIPVIIDRRLQVCTMNELQWTHDFDLIICNTINYHVFLTDRNLEVPVIWWLHDSPFFYEGINSDRLSEIQTTNMKVLSVGPVPKDAMLQFRSDLKISDLLYGVSDGI